MAVITSATTDGLNRIINIELSALQEKADNLADDSAKFYYEIRWKNDDSFKTNNNGVLEITPYDNLTKAQKLSILGLETQYMLKLGAKSYYKKNAVETAETTADTAIETRY